MKKSVADRALTPRRETVSRRAGGEGPDACGSAFGYTAAPPRSQHCCRPRGSDRQIDGSSASSAIGGLLALRFSSWSKLVRIGPSTSHELPKGPQKPAEASKGRLAVFAGYGRQLS